MRAGVWAANHLKLAQLEQEILQFAPEWVCRHGGVPFGCRVLQLHQVTNDELV
jgi:hypothetical protein